MVKVNMLLRVFTCLLILWTLLSANSVVAQDSTIVRFGPPPGKDGRPVRRFNNTDPTANAGKVEWLPRHVDMGVVAVDSLGQKILTVKNISQEDLLIHQVKTTCHCTWAEWPAEAIKPGKTGQIKVFFKGDDVGEIFKILSIQTSFDLENWVLVTVYGTVQ